MAEATQPQKNQDQPQSQDGGAVESQPKSASFSKQRKLPWQSRIDRGIHRFAEAVSILSRGMVSPDGGTRRMSAMFFASCVLLLVILLGGGLWLRNQVGLRGSGEQARNIRGFIQNQIDNADQAAAIAELGSFTIDLRAEGSGRPVSGVVNLAEIAITVNCDGRAACEYIRENLERARDQVTHVFVYTDRAELMSPEGKRRLKTSIIKRLNHILPAGRVVEIYFTKLLIS